MCRKVGPGPMGGERMSTMRKVVTVRRCRKVGKEQKERVQKGEKRLKNQEGSHIVALLRCLFPTRVSPFWPVSPFCAETLLGRANGRLTTVINTPAVGPGMGTFINFLHKPEQKHTDVHPADQQRSDAQRGDPLAQQTSPIGEA